MWLTRNPKQNKPELLSPKVNPKPETRNPKQKNMPTPQQFIRHAALETGFDFCGFTTMDPLTADGDHLSRWLADGFHADMRWMERNVAERTNPALLVPTAKSVIVLLTGYYPGEEPPGAFLKVARYARFRTDYHDSLRMRLQHLSAKINAQWPGAVLRHYTDTGPVLERALAARAGLGWIGRNNCLIVPGAGSYFFISVMFTTLELEADLPVMADHCPPSCRRCLEQCPTGALVEPRRLDSRKCIAYHTIENKGEIPPEVAARMGDRVFGCDICQEVCPWNRRPRLARSPLDELNEAVYRESEHWQNTSHEEFLTAFRKTPLHRTGYQRVLRNARICADHETAQSLEE